MKTISEPDELGEVEKLISTSLTPVSPRPEFVENLYRRLTDPANPRVRFSKYYSLQFILLCIASLLSGIIFLLTTTQVIMALLREMRSARPIERGLSGMD